MALPQVDLRGKRVILLSGFRNTENNPTTALAKRQLEINAIEKLQQSATRHPDAVAFGYVNGKWVPAA